MSQELFHHLGDEYTHRSFFSWRRSEAIGPIIEAHNAHSQYHKLRFDNSEWEPAGPILKLSPLQLIKRFICRHKVRLEGVRISSFMIGPEGREIPAIAGGIAWGQSNNPEREYIFLNSPKYRYGFRFHYDAFELYDQSRIDEVTYYIEFLISMTQTWLMSHLRRSVRDPAVFKSESEVIENPDLEEWVEDRRMLREQLFGPKAAAMWKLRFWEGHADFHHHCARELAFLYPRVCIGPDAKGGFNE